MDHEMLEGIMSDEFDALNATEKAGIEAALNRCRALAAQIESELCNKRHEHFVDKLSLADLCASLERAADVLGQKGRQPVGNTPAPWRRVRGRGTVSDNLRRSSSGHALASVTRTFGEKKRHA